MSLILSAWQIVIKRSISNWRLLSTVLVGVIVAVALLSSAPLYSNAINDLGLKHTLENQTIENLDLQVYAPNYFVDREEYDTATALIDQQVDRNIRQVIRQQEVWIKSATFYAYYLDRETPEGQFQPKTHLQVYTNLEDHITFAEGRMYEPASASLTKEQMEAEDYYIEALIGSESAEKFGVGLGDTIMIEGGYGDNKNSLLIKFVGIIDPVDPDEEFWFLNKEVFTVEQSSEEGPTAPVFIDEETLFNVYPQMFVDGRATFNWLYFVDVDKINSDNANVVKDAIKRMEKQLLSNLPRSALFTSLDSIITQYQGKLMFTQIPLFLIVFQIAAVILYYLVTVSNMLVDRQSGEIAVFRSRGASTWHIIGIYFMEGLVISAVGGVSGPFLGAFAFSLLGRTESFLSLTNGGLLPIRYSDSVTYLAITAAVLCLAALLVPAIQAARRGVVHQRQAAARPPSKPFWQRYYLDVVLLIFGVVLYWELHSRGSLMTMDMFGGLGMDPLLLITPMLLLMAVAIVFLRLFPLLIRLITKISRIIGNAPFVLGLWYMARNPVHYTRLILLLIMAASVGMFSATFLGTLDTSYIERTNYASGGDVRLTYLNSSYSSKTSLENRYMNIEGIDNIGVISRNNGTVGAMFTTTDFTLLGIDPAKMKEIAWFRDDFADMPFEEVMDILEVDVPIDEGLAIPEGSEAIGAWVYSEEDNLPVTLYARIRDGNGRYMDIEMGMAESGNWTYVEGRLTVFNSDQILASPMRLSCLYVRTESTTHYGLGGLQSLYVDNLQAVGPALGQPVVIEDFENTDEWQISPDDVAGSLSGSQTSSGTFRSDQLTVYSGQYSGRFGWSSRGAGKKAVYVNLDDRPLTAVVSSSFLTDARVKEGSIAQIRLPGQFMYAQFVDSIEYFPTLDPERQGFVLVNIERLMSVRNRQLTTSAVYPNEVWLTLNEDPELRAAAVSQVEDGVNSAREYYYKDAMLNKLKTDPLAGAGWSGMLTIAFLGVILVSSLGFIVYSYLSAQQRQLDFAILRTLGFSIRQIIGLVCFEQLFIILVGMGLGTFIGQQLSNIMLPFLQLTEQGERVLPPFILTVNWGTIGMAYALLAVAFIITISLVILFFSRVAIHKTLRMGDL